MDPVSITLICISAGLVLTSVCFIVVSCLTVAETAVVEWVTVRRPVGRYWPHVTYFDAPN